MRSRLVSVSFVLVLIVTLAACSQTLPTPPGAPPPPPPVDSTGTEAGNNPACPPVGAHQVGGASTPYASTSDEGLRNLAKRQVPASGIPVNLTLSDFARLQQDVNSQFGDAAVTKTRFEPTRDSLKSLPIASGNVGEGDLVQLVAYVTIARNEGAETVNCGSVDAHDIHVALGPNGATEYEGIVAEMIPQLPRPPGWDATTLNALHAERVQVLVIGSLTYDNEHLVNADPQHPKGGQPKRMSLWEIHPITAFFLCQRTDGCNAMLAQDWVPLSLPLIGRSSNIFIVARPSLRTNRGLRQSLRPIHGGHLCVCVQTIFKVRANLHSKDGRP